jgi:hypothetical protein
VQELSISHPRWRVAAAFVITPLMAALALACFQPAYDGLASLADRILRTTILYAVFGVYPTTAVLGVPAFLFLKDRVRASPLNCAATGAVIASLPWLTLGLISNTEFAFSNGHVTHQNGSMTWWGWLDLLISVGEIAAVGALAGIFFWCIAAAGAKPSRMSA